MDLDKLAERTLERTWDLHQKIYKFLEAGIEGERSRFDPDRYDPWYFTHSVRHHVCQAIDAIPEEVRGFKRVPFPMSGLELIYREFRVKVWKVNGGEMPIAGQSAGREEFLEQRQPFLENFIDALGTDDLIPLKLFIAWDVNGGLELKDVNLVCPRTFESPWKPGEEYFSIRVPHPAKDVRVPTAFTEEPGELEIPLRRKGAAAGQNDGGDDTGNDGND